MPRPPSRWSRPRPRPCPRAQRTPSRPAGRRARCLTRDPVGDDEAAVESRRRTGRSGGVLLLVALELAGHELARAALGDRAQVSTASSALMPMPLSRMVSVFARRCRTARAPRGWGVLVQRAVVQRLEAQLVAGVGRVGDQLAQEDLLVRVQRGWVTRCRICCTSAWKEGLLVRAMAPDRRRRAPNGKTAGMVPPPGNFKPVWTRATSAPLPPARCQRSIRRLRSAALPYFSKSYCGSGARRRASGCAGRAEGLVRRVLQRDRAGADGLPGRAHQPVVVALRASGVAAALDQRDAADLVARALAGRRS